MDDCSSTGTSVDAQTGNLNPTSQRQAAAATRSPAELRGSLFRKTTFKLATSILFFDRGDRGVPKKELTSRIVPLTWSPPFFQRSWKRAPPTLTDQRLMVTSTGHHSRPLSTFPLGPSVLVQLARCGYTTEDDLPPEIFSADAEQGARVLAQGGLLKANCS